MNLQDKERIIKAFNDALTFEENHRPWESGEDYFNACYGEEPVYTKKVISLFGKDNCTVKIRAKPAQRHSFIEEGSEHTLEEIGKLTLKIHQAPAQNQGRDLSEVYGNSGSIKWIFDGAGYFAGYEFKDADGKEIGKLTKDGWRPAPAEHSAEEVHP